MLIKWLILISDGPGEAKKLAFFAPKSWPFWPLAQILWGAMSPLAPRFLHPCVIAFCKVNLTNLITQLPVCIVNHDVSRYRVPWIGTVRLYSELSQTRKRHSHFFPIRQPIRLSVII